MGRRLFAIARSLVVSALFISLWTWFFPRWFAAGRELELRLGWPVILAAAGAIVMLKCVWDFAWTGLGTPMPLDPPRKFVATGFYRFVRNPMYLGMGLFLVGEAFSLPAITKEMFVMIACCWVAVTLFIIFYEEPTLQRTFGDEYTRYRQSVRRWLPRLTPYHTESA